MPSPTQPKPTCSLGELTRPPMPDPFECLRNDGRYLLAPPDRLPPDVNGESIAEYLETLKNCGADCALIQFTDEDGVTLEIARYNRDAAHSPEKSVHIQSTTKSIFAVYAILTMGEKLWKEMDTPVSQLLGQKKSQNLIASFLRDVWHANVEPAERDGHGHPPSDDALRSLADDIGTLTLRHLFNHAGGIPFYDEELFRVGRSSEARTRYSNTGVEVASIVFHQWLEDEFKVDNKTLVTRAQQFLEEHLRGSKIEFETFPMSSGRVHVLGSGRLNATMSHVSRLSSVVRGMPDESVERLFTPIGDYLTDFKAPWSAGSDPSGKESWGDDLNPDRICNLFFLRPYGYGTRGSFENNCDVVIKHFSLTKEPKDRADDIKRNPYFTVVRLQYGLPNPPNDHGVTLQQILANFFLPSSCP